MNERPTKQSLHAACLFFLLAMSVTGRAQPAQPRQPPPFTSVAGAFFALSVPDLQASAKWYSEKLGLEVVMEAPTRDRVAVVVLEGMGLIVELIQHDGALPLRKAAPAVASSELLHGIFKAGIIVQDFEKTVAALKARGVEFAYGPFPARDRQRANAVIRDNAGNMIQFFGR